MTEHIQTLKDQAVATNRQFIELRDTVKRMVEEDGGLRDRIDAFDDTFCRKIERFIGDITPARLERVLTKLAAS